MPRTPWPGFTGPSYQLSDRWAAIERTVNWYNLVNESAEENKFRIALEPCPGNYPFSYSIVDGVSNYDLPAGPPYNQPNRGLIEYHGRVFGVNGNVVFELELQTQVSAGTFTPIGTPRGQFNQIGDPIVDDGSPVSMVANGGGQIGIASGGHLYVLQVEVMGFPGILPSLSEVTTADFLGANYITFQDGFLISMCTQPQNGQNLNQFQISGGLTATLNDMTLWSAGDVSLQKGQADLLQTIISAREYLFLFGARRSQVYQDVGNAGLGGFPFQNYNQTFIEVGCAAPYSLVDMGDSLIWLGQDDRGQTACWRMANFQPQRISTFAIEQFWEQYTTLFDAVAFSFKWRGNLFYQITFPAANRTWLYNATASHLLGKHCWTERTYTDQNGVEHARTEWFHCFINTPDPDLPALSAGIHLVGSVGYDGAPGAIYAYNSQPWDWAVCPNA